MKKILSLILTLSLALTMTVVFSGCDKNTIVVYTNAEFAPYEFMQGVNVVGVDMEIAEAIGEKLGKKVKIQNVAFDTLTTQLSSLKDNEIMIAGMTITPERQEKADFSDSYATSIQYIIYDNTKTEKMDTIEKLLNSKKVGVQIATTGDYIMSEMEGVETISYESAQAASLILLKGEIDAVVVDKLPAEMIAGKNDKLTAVQAEYIVEEENIFAAEEYGVAVKKGNTELLDSINEVIAQLIKDGKIEEWTNEYSGIVK